MTNLFFIFEEVLNLGAWKFALFEAQMFQE